MQSPNEEIKKLIKIDKAFASLRDGYGGDKRDMLFNNYIGSIALYLNFDINTKVEKILTSSIGIEGQKLIATCLLRLFTVKKFSFDDFGIQKYRVFSLFDVAIGEKIYRSLGITDGMQSFEKEIKLRDLSKLAEDEIVNEIKSLNSLDSIALFRKKYIKSLRNSINAFIVNKFIDNNLVSDTRLNELFSIISIYIDKKQKKSIAVDKLNEAISYIKKYILEAKCYDTEYNNKFILAFANKILIFLNEDINKFDQCKPTILTIEKPDKKYPFHEPGRDILVSLNVINKGPGYAYDVEISTKSSIDNVVVSKPISNLGNLPPSRVNFDIPVRIATSEAMAFLNVDIVWKNFDNSIQVRSFVFELDGQRSDIPWERITTEQPYSLEAVETAEELVGREEILNKLLRQTLTKSVGSSYIFGQKRVGKTSIVKTLRSRIRVENYLVIFLESGDYICPTAEGTVKKLGQNLCDKIKRSNPKFSNLPLPQFEDGALSSLITFLDSVELLEPTIRILIILDEFDELPTALYKRGPFGDSFFLTLRSISQKAPFGFILVGGEKIAYIMSCQGDALNKFRSMRVDYFDKQNYWNDFIELVRRPVKQWFEISDDAINYFYQQTSGNPFYTKWICSNMFEIMNSLRDCHVSLSEAEIATNKSLSEIASNSFQHFWEDGIFENHGDITEEISIKRRKILLAFASLLRSSHLPNKDNLSKHELLNSYGHEDISSELEQFVRRKILVESNGIYSCEIKFFERWLTCNGFNEILTTFVDLDSIVKRKQNEEKSFVKSEEIVELTKKWAYYKGQKITDDKVRTWLNQFGNNTNQRLMFKILQSVNYYSSGRVREKLRQAHDIVKRGMTIVKTEGKTKQDEFLVSYLDCPGKSGGGIYAKLYADENKIYYSNVIEKQAIADSIAANNSAKALIFVDDFVGTGGTAKKYFTEISNTLGEVLKNSELKVYFLVICGFENKKDELDTFLQDIGLAVHTHICDPLDDSAKCFSDKSDHFSHEEREQAKLLAYEYGTKLVNKNYLGFGDCQTAIVFETNCPNNNLPILWESSESLPWIPLFPRK